MAETVRPVGAAGFLADRVQAAVPQGHLHLVQLPQVHPFLGDPFGQAGMIVESLAAGAFGETGHR